jgi:hypothetical protein
MEVRLRPRLDRAHDRRARGKALLRFTLFAALAVCFT